MNLRRETLLSAQPLVGISQEGNSHASWSAKNWPSGLNSLCRVLGNALFWKEGELVPEKTWEERKNSRDASAERGGATKK